MIPGERIAAEVADALRRARPSPSPVREFLDEWILGPLDRLVRGLFGTLVESAGPWLAYGLFALVVIVALALLVYLATWLIQRRESALRTAASVHAARAGRTDVDPEASEREAARLAAAGDFAGAVRMLYLAAVVRLLRRAGKPFDVSLTPGEILRGFRAAPFASTLRAFVREYEVVSFGARPLDPEGYRRVAGLVPAEASA